MNPCNLRRDKIKVLNYDIKVFYSGQKKKRVRKGVLPGNSKSLWDAVKIAKDLKVETIPKTIYTIDQMRSVTEYRMTQTVIYRVILTTCTQKETGLLIPFVVAILGTKFLKNLCLVRQNSAQLRTGHNLQICLVGKNL